MELENHILENTIGVFKNYKTLAEKSFSQLSDTSHFHYSPHKESNSIAVIIKHMSGNMVSRWTDFLITDGEKETRNRDAEFVSGTETREELLMAWEKGWTILFNTLNSLTANDLIKTVTIRGEGLTVFQALNRQIAHYSYHVGQIVFLAKQIKNEQWQSLSIPRNKSQEHIGGGTYLNNLK
ncbi:MAG: DUF1572 family protein [Bacteroidia bacterium]|nr:DUF1572 family protein [Bacteroidia bacterium]